MEYRNRTSAQRNLNLMARQQGINGGGIALKDFVPEGINWEVASETLEERRVKCEEINLQKRRWE